MMHDSHVGFADDRKVVLHQQVVVLVNGTSEAVFDRSRRRISVTGCHRFKHLLEGATGNRVDAGAEQLSCGVLAEGSAFALECNLNYVFPRRVFRSSLSK